MKHKAGSLKEEKKLVNLYPDLSGNREDTNDQYEVWEGDVITESSDITRITSMMNNCMPTN